MNGSAYYNENNAYCAAWLRNLVSAGHIAPGDVDERSIEDVRADDLAGYDQCHFFAGIGGWSYALRLAGWPDDRPAWTGSCPCQPFSIAGKHRGTSDARHLWPVWFRLIREFRPATVIGEQVAAAIGAGWLDSVFSDMEGEGYACGAAVLPACGASAPHVRRRAYWVGLEHASGEGLEGLHIPQRGDSLQSTACNVRRAWEAEPDVARMADGLRGRVGQVRAYGNAIVPPLAAEFIAAVGEATL